MKRHEIVEIVEAHFTTFDKLRHKILKDFEAGDIHDFRVAVKKLRAFLRLADIKREEDKPLLPKLLKTFYGYIGILRNIHLQKHAVYKYTADGKHAIPEAYLQLLTDEEDYWKKDTLQLMEDNNFDEVKDKLLHALPDKISKERLQKFTAESLNALASFLATKKNDDITHSIRKILKTILYVYPYIKDEVELPALISTEHALKAFTDIAGDYLDKHVQLEFFKPQYLDRITDENEKGLLLKMQQSCEAEKKSMKQKLYRRFYALKKQLSQQQNPLQ